MQQQQQEEQRGDKQHATCDVGQQHQMAHLNSVALSLSWVWIGLGWVRFAASRFDSASFV